MCFSVYRSAVKIAAGLLIAACALTGARFARSAASDLAPDAAHVTKSPFAPTPATAPFVSLGYRQAMADLMYVRLIGYFNGDDSTGDGVADLAESIVALDPRFQRAYDHAANAMTLAKSGVDQAVNLRAIALLEAGYKQFPDDWRLPFVAGQIYTQDLKTDDPAQKRAWDEKGALLLDAATRKPGAPQGAAAWVAIMRSKLGQHERAVTSLREMLLVTNDTTAREKLLKALAKIESRDANSVDAEIRAERAKFDDRWRAERRTLPATMYVLVGARIVPGFDMTDLATGGRDLVIDEPIVPLEPLE